MNAPLDRRPWTWLILGFLLLVLSQLRFGVGALAWIAPVPWLRYLRLTQGWRSRAGFLAALVLAWSVAVAKIVTDPVPLVLAPAFGLPVALALGAAFLVWARWRPVLGEGPAAMAFASATVAGEWLLHGLLPFGTWGAGANTQLEYLPILQLASVTGLHGISFLIALVAASVEPLFDGVERPRVRRAAVALALVALAWIGGEARLVAGHGSARETRTVAAVGTDATFGGLPLPEAPEIEAIEAALFRRTRQAAAAGAELVVWTEAATLVRPEDEPAWLARIGALAREQRLHLVAGYVVPVSTDPLRFENKYAFVTPQGTVDHRYLKHHPVPGEPAIAGTEPMPVFVSEALGRVSGAICYDYDFPRIALEQAGSEVALVALPSSDWRGIDPIHTQMAALRAIEGGQAVVRSTRFGLSAGIDGYGRIRGWLSAWDDTDRVLVVELPRHRIRTVYGALGDWFPLASAAALVLLAFAARRGWGARW